MRESLSFPGLGLEFSLDRVAFRLGEWPVYWYGVLIAAGFLLGALYTMRRVKQFGLDSDRTMDVLMGSILIGIVGARLYYVAFSWDTYKEHLSWIFNTRLGGLAIYGGIIGACLGAIVMCRWRKVKLLPFLDLSVGGLFLGQAIGRWGNFINIEAFGSNTTKPWGITSPTIQWYLQQNQDNLEKIGILIDPAVPVHPTFFYESVWCLFGFAFIAWFTARRRYDGELALIYCFWYGLGRFWIEGLRTDSLMLGTIRVSQMFALMCVIAAAAAMVVIRVRIRKKNSAAYLPLYVDTPEGQLIVAGRFYPVKKRVSEQEGQAVQQGKTPPDPLSAEETVKTEKQEES